MYRHERIPAPDPIDWSSRPDWRRPSLEACLYILAAVLFTLGVIAR